MIENKEINKSNIANFKIFGCSNLEYTCCLCGRECYTDESYSNHGDRLICYECCNTKFKTFKDARNWIDRKEYDFQIIEKPINKDTIKQSLIKAGIEHKALEILTNKINIELNFLNNSLYVGDYNSELSEEEFKILKEVL